MRYLQVSMVILTCFAVSGCVLNPIPSVRASLQKKSRAVSIPNERVGGLMKPELMDSNMALPVDAILPENGTATVAEGGLFDFSTVTQSSAQGTSRVAWKQSVTEAIDQARLTGKPILIFFTSQHSAPSMAMEKTMVLTKNFRVLVEENYIPLRVDYSDMDTQRSEFYKSFKEQMKPRGYPTLLVILPDGAEIMRLTGYKTEYQENNIKRLQQAVEQSKKTAEQRRSKMLKEGYRLWTNKKDVDVFAKLTKLDANMGTFTGEWGNTFTTFITRLSDKDQAWIEEQKRLRQGS